MRRFPWEVSVIVFVIVVLVFATAHIGRIMHEERQRQLIREVLREFKQGE